MWSSGLGTTTIAEVLPCMVKDGDQLVTPCSDLLELLARERDRIGSTIRELASAREILDAIITRPGPEDSPQRTPAMSAQTTSA